VRAEHVAWVTGQGSPNRTGDAAAVYGTDLGICWEDGAGGVLVAFGDTYGRGWGGDGAGGHWWTSRRRLDWRMNVLARSTDRDLARGMRLDSWVTDRPGHARQVLPRDDRPDVHEHTLIPTAGIAVDGRQYLGYMSVRQWNVPGGWRTNHAGIARSDDGGETWHKPVSAQWANLPDGSQNWQMCAFARHEGHVYVFGTPNGREGAATLARAPADAVLDLARHEQWTGSGWTADPSRAAVVIPAPVSELSVMFHRPSGRWLAAYLEVPRAAIVVRTAEALTGPWSEPHPVASGTDWPRLYGGFFHPWSAELDTPYFLMSVWGPYNVVLMRLDLAAR
jgi:hypothetical protein